MKLSKRILLLCLLLGTLILTGCGIEVSTDMTIDNNFNGRRIISCYVSKQDMQLNFKGDNAKIDTMIENNCPGCFEYEKIETESGTEFIFTLTFDSLEDYKTQLSSVLHFSPEITYKGVNSLFSKSIDLTENFTSLDLLRWFEILLTEEYSISESQLESLWDMKDTTVSWLDESYTSKTEAIQISDHNCSAFDGISIYTEEKDNRTFQRRIRFSIPTSTLDKRVLELEKAFESIKPSGATGIWSVTETGKVYELTFQAKDFETLSKLTSEALNRTEQEVSSNTTISDYQYLKLHLEYSEVLDFSYYLSTDTGDVPVNYYFKPNSMTEIDSERIQKEVNNAFVPKLYDGYYRIFSGSCSSLNISTLGILTLPVTSYSIETTIKKEEQLQREFLFTFENALRQKEQKLLASILANNSNDTLSMTLLDIDGNCTISIVQIGTKDSLNHSSGLIFGSENNEITYEKQSFLQFFSSKKLTQIRDHINLSGFLGPDSETIQGKYILNDKATQGIEEFYLQSETSDISYPEEQDTLTHSASITGNQFTMYYTGSEPSVVGILFLVILLLLLIGSIIFFLKRNPMKQP